MKKLIIIASIFFIGCAETKTFNIAGKDEIIEPYGLLNEEFKHDSITYQLSQGNVINSIIFSETIIVPVWLCGWELYEPIKKK